MKTEINLQSLYDDLKFELNPGEELSTVTPVTKEIKEDSIFSTLHRNESQRKRKANEVNNYFNDNITELADLNTNPFKW